MQIILFDKNPEITYQWFRYFGNLDNVTVFTGLFQELPAYYDKIVMSTAGNSYGIMGGGLDLAIAKRFSGIEEFIQSTIEELHPKEGLYPGQALVIPLTKDHLPFVSIIYTPTMRIPMKLRNAENVYYATMASLSVYNMIYSSNYYLALPGFGGSCGGLPPYLIARTMRFAYDHYTKGNFPRTHVEMYELYSRMKGAWDV